MEFNKLESSLNVFTAGSKMATSSFTFQFVHISELSKWEGDVSATWTSLMQTLPTGADIIVESTANGVGNLYHDMWLEAKAGKSDFYPMFFPWFEQDEYQIPEREGEVFIPDEEEKYYMDRHDLSLDQVRWMRYTRLNKCKGSWSTFRQEYPANPEEAFLESGNPRFNIKKLRDREIEIKDIKPVVGEFKLEDVDLENKKKGFKVSFARDDSGSVKIFHPPQSRENGGLWRHRYAFGSDVSEGIDRNDNKGKNFDTDWNVTSVMDKVFPVENDRVVKQVCEIRNKNELFDYARQIFCAMAYYGRGLEPSYWGMAGIERNNSGLSVLLFLRSMFRDYGIPIHRIYHKMTMDATWDTPSENLGWRTTADSKPLIIDAMANRILYGTDGIMSEQAVKECMYYVRDNRGRTNAQQGKHDDEVMSLAITYEVIRTDKVPIKHEDPPPAISGWRKRVFGLDTGSENGLSYYYDPEEEVELDFERAN